MTEAPTTYTEEARQQQARDIRKAREYSENLGVDDLKWFLSDKRGRRFMWRLLSETGLFRPSYTGNSETFFREGERNVGLKLLNQILEHCPDKFGMMQQEHTDEQRSSDRRKQHSSRAKQ